MRIDPRANGILDPAELVTVLSLEVERGGRAIDREVARCAHASEVDAQARAEVGAREAAATERTFGLWSAAFSLVGGATAAMGGAGELVTMPSNTVRMVTKLAPALGQAASGGSQACSAFSRGAATEADGRRAHELSVSSRAAQRAAAAESRIAESLAETRRALDLFAEYSSARSAEGRMIRG
jgi:hypothetical protein